MIPVECVVRNIAAGGLVKRLGVEEGIALNPPTFELFLKNDEKGDPMINESLAETFGWATPEQLAKMKTLTFKVNHILKQLFAEGDMLLVDYKLEFGVFKGEVVLGDEFSRMAAVYGMPTPARSWIRTASVRGWVASLKPTKKSAVV